MYASHEVIVIDIDEWGCGILDVYGEDFFINLILDDKFGRGELFIILLVEKEKVISRRKDIFAENYLSLGWDESF